MASKGCLRYLRQVNGLARTVNPTCRRSMATVSEVPLSDITQESSNAVPSSSPGKAGIITDSVTPTQADHEQPADTVLTTVYSFPTMQPLHFAYYPNNHLYLPLRKDILHRAVVYEGDKTRLGTASTLWRSEVHGSHKKLYAQKGTGKARVGDKQSPIRRGGGVAFGPKPRDFATELNRKVYDLAWRTALSFRYRKGELIVVDQIRNLRTQAPHWIKQIFARNEWGSANKRSLLVAEEKRPNNKKLFTGMQYAGEEGRLLAAEDVDVKDLLEMGRVIIEYEALNQLLRRHRSDLVRPVHAPAAIPSELPESLTIQGL